MILVDTSVWVEFFRRPKPLEFARAVDLDEVIICPPIVQEVLQGIRDPDAYRSIRQSLLALPIVEAPMSLDVWLEAAQLYRTARHAGITVRSTTDCLIAACALRHDAEVLHRDRDFTLLATIAPLRARQP
ncbi:MAG: PIN domain-containing protein [Planctomycetes bacterium]|nr:PIN domain-containing protein [Planctomycetota bacterium]